MGWILWGFCEVLGLFWLLLFVGFCLLVCFNFLGFCFLWNEFLFFNEYLTLGIFLLDFIDKIGVFTLN